MEMYTFVSALIDRLFLWQRVCRILYVFFVFFKQADFYKTVIGLVYATNKWIIFHSNSGLEPWAKFLFSKRLDVLVLRLGNYCAVLAKWTLNQVSQFEGADDRYSEIFLVGLCLLRQEASKPKRFNLVQFLITWK